MSAANSGLVTVVYSDGSEGEVHFREAASLVSRGRAVFAVASTKPPKKAAKKAAKKAGGPKAPKKTEKVSETPEEAGETTEDLSGAAPEGQDADTAGYEPHDLI